MSTIVAKHIKHDIHHRGLLLLFKRRRKEKKGVHSLCFLLINARLCKGDMLHGTHKTRDNIYF